MEVRREAWQNYFKKVVESKNLKQVWTVVKSVSGHQTKAIGKMKIYEDRYYSLDREKINTLNNE